MVSIAIDGPSGSGKSSISKRLAEKLKFVSLDTGALYRAIAYFLKINNIDYKNENLVKEKLENIKIDLQYLNSAQKVYVNGEDVTDKIRFEDISLISSFVAAMPCVRDYLLDLQRDMAKKYNIIMDGRDIGTVVLPNATVKIFLTASPEVRAERRYRELNEKGEKLEYQDVLDSVIKRDFNDANRKISPLKCPKDAVLFDSSKFTFDQTVDELLKIIKEKIHAKTK